MVACEIGRPALVRRARVPSLNKQTNAIRSCAWWWGCNYVFLDASTSATIIINYYYYANKFLQSGLLMCVMTSSEM